MFFSFKSFNSLQINLIVQYCRTLDIRHLDNFKDNGRLRNCKQLFRFDTNR